MVLRVTPFELGKERVQVLCRHAWDGLDRASDGVNLVPLKVAAGFFEGMNVRSLLHRLVLRAS